VSAEVSLQVWQPEATDEDQGTGPLIEALRR